MISQVLEMASEEIQYKLASWRHQYGSQAQDRLQKILVNGSPKSGTTWMRGMLESLPGYQRVGNFDGNIDKYHQVAAGDVIHGHDWYRPELGQILQQNNIRIVLMIRDPRDQLVSRMFHVKRSANHGWHDRVSQMSDEEALMLCIEGGGAGMPSMSEMITMAQSWLTNEDAQYIAIKYEALRAEPVKYFNQVLRYVGIEDEKLAKLIVERNRFERLSVGKRFWQQQRKPGQEDKKSHYRKGIVGDWRNHLNADHIAKFKETAGQQLIDLGYETDLAWE